MKTFQGWMVILNKIETFNKLCARQKSKYWTNWTTLKSWTKLKIEKMDKNGQKWTKLKMDKMDKLEKLTN